MIADLHGRTQPIARISRGALTANLTGLPRELYVNAQHDGWGHGADLVAEVARERNLAGVVRSETEIEAFAGEVADEYAAVTPALAYGLLPETRPVLSLVGTVLSTKELLAGEGVSYGYRHRATEDSRVALVTGGYAQGIVRSLGDRLSVSVAGERRPVVGRVAMDVCVVDIGDLDVEPGAEVILLGDPARDEPGIADWQQVTGLSALEMLVPIGMRAMREVVA